MTAVFDALLRILNAYEKYFNSEDFSILYHSIEAMHCLQHREGNHRIDHYILKQIVFQERFQIWLDPFKAEKLIKEIQKEEVENES